MSFRQEKKLDIVYSSLNKILFYLSNNGFVKSYPDRKIFSCYFDTSNYSMHNQSEEGVIPRKKIRVRWYNEANSKKVFLEKKITLHDKRFKNSFHIDYKKFFSFQKNGYVDNQYGICHPKIITIYNRSYFHNSNFRVTLDTNIAYKKYSIIGNSLIVLDRKPVLEVKYSGDVNQNFYEKLFFFKEIRFSKYSRGILFLKRSRFS